jgi:ComF family protein
MMPNEFRRPPRPTRNGIPPERSKRGVADSCQDWLLPPGLNPGRVGALIKEGVMLRKVGSSVGRWIQAAASFFYPEVCQHCQAQRASPAEGFICSACRQEVRWIRAPYCDRCGLPYSGAISGPFQCANCHDMDLQFSFGRAAVAADGMVLDLIHRWKYQRALWLEPFLAGLLAEAVAAAVKPGDWQLIVPVPLHGRKERDREFNQAEHLARRLGAALGLPVNSRAVVRRAATRTQTRLTRAQRNENMRRAFGPGPRLAGVRSRRIILVDDVLTTGATTSACAAVLRAAGAGEVCVWTLARGLLQ